MTLSCQFPVWKGRGAQSFIRHGYGGLNVTGAPAVKEVLGNTRDTPHMHRVLPAQGEGHWSVKLLLLWVNNYTIST